MCVCFIHPILLNFLYLSMSLSCILQLFELYLYGKAHHLVPCSIVLEGRKLVLPKYPSKNSEFG